MSVVISDEILRAARMSHDELLLEIAVMLFEKEKVTLAQAARLSGMNRFQFQHLLSSRGIPVHYGIKEFEEDLKTLRKLERI